MKCYRPREWAAIAARASLIAAIGGIPCAAVILFGYVGDPNRSVFRRNFGPAVGDAALMVVFIASACAFPLISIGIAALVFSLLIRFGLVSRPILDGSKGPKAEFVPPNPVGGAVWDRDIDGP